jgi:metal-responsive CopG/Arc/MetJ family transcriptional regulator
MTYMAKIKIDSNLLARIKDATETAGYSSVEEFVTHVIEKELVKYEEEQADENISERLRGLGYIE